MNSTYSNERFKQGYTKLTDDDIIKYSKELEDITIKLKSLYSIKRAGNYTDDSWLQNSITQLENERNLLKDKLSEMTYNENVSNKNSVEFTIVTYDCKSRQRCKVGKSKDELAKFIIEQAQKELIHNREVKMLNTGIRGSIEMWSLIPDKIKAVLGALYCSIERYGIGEFNSIALYKENNSRVIPIGIVRLSKKIQMEFGITKLFIRIDKIRAVEGFMLNGIEIDKSMIVTSIT